MADECNLGYNYNNKYFKSPSIDSLTRSVASELPNGIAWRAKLITTTVMYAFVYASAGMFKLITDLVETLSLEFNLFTAVNNLSEIEKSVGLPDTRTPPVTNICLRRARVLGRLNKNPIVTIGEIQALIDTTFPDLGIYISTNVAVGAAFRYDFRMIFNHNQFASDRFTLVVNIPWYTIDPASPETGIITWNNLQNWFRDFIPAYDLLTPNYLPKDSYVSILSPFENQNLYIQGTSATIPVDWILIDVDGWSTRVQDFENIDLTTTEITRSFTDSNLNLIEHTINVSVIPIL